MTSSAHENLCKVIMVRSRLRNIFLKLKTEDSWNAYRKQRNYCVSLLRITKRKFYEDLKPNSITDNKKFWKQVKPYFSDKTPSNSRITLSEGNEIISNPVQCAEIFNNFFSDPVKNLDINRRLHVCDVRNIHDPIIKAIEMYKDHPSITKINSLGFTNAEFSFKPVTEKVVQDFIKNLDSSKAFQKYNIPPKLLKNNIDICTTVLSYDINKCINEGIFPSNLKDANITPIFKKLARLFKENYRPVSILPTLSKIYEKVFYYQMYDYFNDIFSKFLCGFRKGHSTQNCLLYMMEYLKKALDKGLSIGILLTDLSKAFDCISHGLLIAKLNAYGFSMSSLNLISNYLSERKQRTKIGDSFSSWRDVIYGVPQGSVLGPLLFNIYINDLFMFSQDFFMANYADDCSPYECAFSSDDVILKLQHDSQTLIEWYENNYLKPNPDKWHFLLSKVEDGKEVNITVGNTCISNSSAENILGVYFDNKFTFQAHLRKLCKIASGKLHALARISNYMSCKQRKIIMNAFITSQFNYCPLIWMCHGRSINAQINKIHERALRIVYRDYTLSFEELLKKSESMCIHHRNIHLLAIEMYKVFNKISTPLMSELFKIKDNKYDLRKGSTLASSNIHTTSYGIDSLSYLGPRIWDLVPREIKGSVTLNVFKNKIKYWKPTNCPCRLCKTYVPNLGYL